MIVVAYIILLICFILMAVSKFRLESKLEDTDLELRKYKAQKLGDSYLHENEYNKLLAKHSKSKSELEEGKAEIEKLKQVVAGLSKHASNSTEDKELTELKYKISNIEAQNKQLEKTVKETTVFYNSVNDQLVKTTEELEAAKQTKSRYQESYSIAVEEINNLNLHIGQLESELEKTTSELCRVENQFDPRLEPSPYQVWLYKDAPTRIKRMFNKDLFGNKLLAIQLPEGFFDNSLERIEMPYVEGYIKTRKKDKTKIIILAEV